MIYSYSRLKSYDCPRRFYEKYVLEKKEPSGEAAFFGSVVHKTIESLLANGFLRNYCQDIFAGALDAGIIDCSEKEQSNGFAAPKIDREEVTNLVKRALTYLQTNNIARQLELESHFQFPIDPDDPFSPELQGYRDVVCRHNSNIMIIDWKSNQRSYSVCDNQQMPLYAWATMQEKRVNAVIGVLNFLRLKENEGWIESYHFLENFSEPLEASRRWAYDRACEIEGKLAELDFGADPDTLFTADPAAGQCKYCYFAKECQQQSEEKPESVTNLVAELAKDELEIASPEHAQEIAAEFLRLKAVADKMQDALKTYCKTTGEYVTVGDQQYAGSVSVSWSFNDPEQKKALATAILTEKGLNPWEIISIGATEINKAGFTEDELIALGGKRKETITCRWTKAPKESSPQKPKKKQQEKGAGKDESAA